MPQPNSARNLQMRRTSKTVRSIALYDSISSYITTSKCRNGGRDLNPRIDGRTFVGFNVISFSAKVLIGYYLISDIGIL